jgi:hypothetical protein
MQRVWRAADGCLVDCALYLVSMAFALITAGTATLPPHGAWGRVAVWGYAAATLLALGQLALPRLRTSRLRAALLGGVFVSTALLPLLAQAVQRAAGRGGRAQEEVLVVEQGGARLLHTGTPYLGHDAIAALPVDERLLGYLPYQPGMALFGLPRAVFGAGWPTDARVWFALVTAGCVAAAAVLLRHAGVADGALIRAGQAVLAVPLVTLALAVGGDDVPVLALCLLALAYAAVRRDTAAGVAVGVAAALKLFAWPVIPVLLVLAVTRRAGGRAADRRAVGRAPDWRAGARVAVGALGVPLLALIPATLVDPDAAVENVLRFPLGHGLVRSPAASNFPGHLIALWLPGGATIAAGLLLVAGLVLAGRLVRRPPRDAGDAAAFCAAGLLTATLLMPSTRFGYLLYPLAFAVWVPALRPPWPPEAPISPSAVPAQLAGQTLEG